MAAPWAAAPGGVKIHIRATPNAGRDAIEGVEARDDGSAVLRIRVSAVPDRGKANAAVMSLLAKTLGCPKSAVSLIAGETARQKTLFVAGDAAEILSILERLESAGG